MLLETIDTINTTTTTVLGAGLIDLGNEKTNEGIALLKNIVRFVGFVVFVVIAFKSRTVGGVILGVLVGGFIFAAPSLMEWFAPKVSEELNGASVVNQSVDYTKALYLAHRS